MVNGWEVASAACGVIYFTTWSGSFYPQLILNFRRRSTLGLSPDFVIVNPMGFLCLTIWSFGAYFSPTARRQYQERHHGHLPQVSKSDLAFSAHALLLSSITLVQSLVYYYEARQRRKNPVPSAVEAQPLVAKDSILSDAPTTPLKITRVMLALMAIATVYELTSLALGRTELLDVLYFASSLKILITTLKYIPQLILNQQLKSVRGFAIHAVMCDLTGGIFSLLQLVISSVWIDGQVEGIWANPGKLGLSLLTIGFDIVFLVQRYILYPPRSHVDEAED